MKIKGQYGEPDMTLTGWYKEQRYWFKAYQDADNPEYWMQEDPCPGDVCQPYYGEPEPQPEPLWLRAVNSYFILWLAHDLYTRYLCEEDY